MAQWFPDHATFLLVMVQDLARASLKSLRQFFGKGQSWHYFIAKWCGILAASDLHYHCTLDTLMITFEIIHKKMLFLRQHWLMLFHFAWTRDWGIRGVLDAALLAHFVSALTICKSKGITCNTFDLLVLTLDHKMSTALVALMPMKWAINPFFHLVKLILIAFCKRVPSV